MPRRSRIGKKFAPDPYSVVMKNIPNSTKEKIIIPWSNQIKDYDFVKVINSHSNISLERKELEKIALDLRASKYHQPKNCCNYLMEFCPFLYLLLLLFLPIYYFSSDQKIKIWVIYLATAFLFVMCLPISIFYHGRNIFYKKRLYNRETQLMAILGGWNKKLEKRGVRMEAGKFGSYVLIDLKYNREKIGNSSLVRDMQPQQLDKKKEDKETIQQQDSINRQLKEPMIG